VILGNGLMLELEGDVDCPFPNRAVMIIKYFLGVQSLVLSYEPFILGYGFETFVSQDPRN
jgi:hypothetical protein